ncbi:cytochrome c-type biogenesis protein CcmH [Nisaea acidiphila]|uniref:Cytochrome c-type biogenesis protein n=1 Tax=Nisaea acidiphila TaxID=1862145 RepID=A0A9J7AYV1_9PROT|nr:cytochrome c-type biogenesis protein [Nisaea acidiphila]UUX51444.1 cytochrome c-type biogenesis protein CcmH [Nisaea acidiphila]
MRNLVLALFLCGLALPALAVNPSEMLEDPAQEARARELSKEIRCLVCQNQSIDDSNAGLARDLRVLLRERIVAGDDDAEIKEFLVERYGDFVLLKPPVKMSTYVLWYGPLAVGLLGAIGVAIFLLRRRGSDTASVAPAPLSDEEKRRVEALLEEQDGKA